MNQNFTGRSMLVVWIIVIAMVIGISSSMMSGIEDGPIEELSESVIESELGLPKDSIDLTPGSEEK